MTTPHDVELLARELERILLDEESYSVESRAAVLETVKTLDRAAQMARDCQRLRDGEVTNKQFQGAAAAWRTYPGPARRGY